MLRRGLIASAFFLALALPAAARELVIKNFSAVVTVHPDGTTEVTEIIEAHFTGQWNGIYRTIPVEYTNPQGFNYTLFIDSISVTDDNGHPLKYEMSREGRDRKFKIWVPGAQDATRTVMLHYRVRDALRFFDDHDELYWNVTGNAWEVPIESANARIELPAGVTGSHAVSYMGSNYSREQDADVSIEGNIVRFETKRQLRYHEGLTVAVGWDKGFVHQPGPLENATLFLESNWPLGLPIAVFFIMFWLFWTRGRDPQRLAISVQYEPPDGLTPGEAGTLVDNEAAMRDITATIVDLAVKGYLLIEQKEKSQMLGLTHHNEYVFHLKKPAAQWQQAKPHEQEILDALFEGGGREQVSLAELQNHFYTHLSAIRDRIFDALMADNYYLHRPDKVRTAYLGGGVVVGILIVAASGFISATFGAAPSAAVVAGILSGLIICGFGWFMPARTITGARTLEKVLGFEDFLGKVEEPRFERIVKTPEMFEKFLPYAMALHVEKKWANAFKDIYRTPPSWYQGPYGGGFYPYLFVNDLNAMSVSAGSAMASAPRSSGGSGFGGGGFSGGGFGGGGGGGF